MSKRYTATAKLMDVFGFVWTRQKDFDDKFDAAIWLTTVRDFYNDELLNWVIYDNANEELFDAMEM